MDKCRLCPIPHTFQSHCLFNKFFCSTNPYPITETNVSKSTSITLSPIHHFTPIKTKYTNPNFYPYPLLLTPTSTIPSTIQKSTFTLKYNYPPFVPPPPPSPSVSPQWSQTPESLSDLSSPEISSDESDDDFGIPIEWPPSRPMVNFAHATELEEDYEIGWQWHEQDPGPLVAPYTGFQQCLLDPTKQKPEDFFNALFSSQMYTIITEETNRYVQQKIKRGKFLTNYLFISNQCKTFFQDPEIIYVTRSNSFLLKQCFLSIEIKPIFFVYITKNFPKIQTSELHQQNSQNNVKSLFT